MWDSEGAPMTKRHHAGELEAKVMEALWAADEPLTPAQVHHVISQDRDLAYTTVMSTLARLWRRGVVSRTRAGRAFAYRPNLTREEHVAARMLEVLGAATDPSAALAHFVHGLRTEERSEFRRLFHRGSG